MINEKSFIARVSLLISEQLGAAVSLASLSNWCATFLEFGI